MRAQTTRALVLGAVLIMPTLFVNSAFADDTQKLKIHFAGGFVQNILQMQVDAMGVPTGVESRSMALVKGRGTFGRVDIMAITVGGPPISDATCSGDLIKIADIVENNLVLTFGDLSLLYGNGAGAVCLNPRDPTAFPLAEVKGTWDGGTGRFEHAGGTWSIQFNFAEPVGMATQFVAETGEIKGYLTGLRDDD